MVFRATQQTVQVTNAPAFVGGINSYAPLANMPSTDVLYTYNLVAKEAGMAVRDGTIEWANSLTGQGVKTIMPFVSADTSSSSDRLFGVTDEGIYDITTQGDTSPTQDVAWGDVSPESGECSYINFTNDAGSFLLVADEENGYRYYSDAGGWVTPNVTYDPDTGPIVDIEDDIAFVTVWKQRVWLVARNSAYAYYLEIGAIAGAATRINFGNRLSYGGNLVGLYNWTVDGGIGIDDHLVVVGSEGDCLVYKGTNPNDDLNLVGSYYIGPTPYGRRIALSYGGDLLILTTQGLISVTSLLRGAMFTDAESEASGKVSRIIRDLMSTRASLFGWSLMQFPDSDTVCISIPPCNQSGCWTQLVMDTGTNAWSYWRDIPMLSAATWKKKVIVGYDSERVFFMSGDDDDVRLDGTGNVPIEFSLLSSFQSLGAPGMTKRIEMMRPTWQGIGTPIIEMKAVYDYDFNELQVPLGSPGASGAGVWQPDAEVGEWDLSVWGGSISTSSSYLGSAGMGRMVAIAIRGRSTGKTNLVDINVFWNQGGMM